MTKQDKQPTTTLESVLTIHDGKGNVNTYYLRQFTNAVTALKNTNQDVIQIRHAMYQTGCALNNLYRIGKQKKIKKGQLTKLVEQYFPESILNRFDRSHYRKYATNYLDYESFAQAFEIRSITIPYIMSKYNEHVKTTIEQNKAKLKQPTDKNIATDENGNAEKVINKTQNRVISETPIPKGMEALVPNKQVTTDEFCVQLNLIVNGFIRRFNADEFTAEQLNDIERLFNNALQHMNDTATIDKIVEKSSKKKAVNS